MSILCYYDTKKNRRKEFVRLQIKREGTLYIFAELECKEFSGQVASGEIDRQEYDCEKDARVAYKTRIGELMMP